MMLEINNITKMYKKGSQTFTALDSVSLKVEKGDFFSVIGSSGSGKSTLLHTIGGLIHPDTGKVFFKNDDIYNLSRIQINQYRKKNVGFVFQQFHLMPYLSVIENIKLACYAKTHFDFIDKYLADCGLSGQKHKFPSEISVGEKQRTAFIRAIISNPDLLLADEPTGNLDPGNSTILFKLIQEFNIKGGTVILVSHDQAATKYSTRTLTLERGKIIN